VVSRASPISISRQWLIIAAILAIACASLGLGYFWFVRTDYAVLAARVRPEQAAAMVDQLKKDNVSYELKDGGSTILVPSSKADSERLQMAGEDLPLKGTVGFELFNQSDMGLTDFAQKVNYQRALQGEIARTIMSMDGIAYARVHLALPERSLFRTSASEPRAAVTLTPEPGVEIDAGRIAGIQRLVAASVPDLALDQVAVLDERGELLTPEFSDVPGQEDGNAAEANYRSRVLDAIRAVAPRAHLEVKVTIVPQEGGSESATTSSDSASGQTRDHALRIVLFEPLPLASSEEQAIRKSIGVELALDEARGDQLSFSPAPQVANPIPTSLPESTASAPAAPSPNGPDRLMESIVRGWTVALSLLAAAAVLIAVFSVWRRKRQRREALAARIRNQLLLPNGVHDVA
jgi:flagellar M-ring protein FliF